MNWKKITLTSEQIGQGHLEHIMNEWLSLVVKSGNPKLAVPLIGNASMNGATHIYFPPDASPFWDDISSEYGAVPCGPPTEPTTPTVRLNQSEK
jgi:hypothetical protein